MVACTVIGDWSGQLTGQKGRWLGRGDTAGLTLRGTPKTGWKKIECTLDGLEVAEVDPSIWDAESRGAILFLRCRQPGKDRDLWLRVSGQFSEDSLSFTGEFDSNALGNGAVELTRAKG